MFFFVTHQLQDKRVLGVEIEILTVASEQLSLYVIPSEPHTASSFLLSFSSHTGHGAFGVGSISHPDNIIIVIWALPSTGWQKLRDCRTGVPRKVRISAKGEVPKICYFVANSCFVAIYALLRMLSEIFFRNTSCFR